MQTRTVVTASLGAVLVSAAVVSSVVLSAPPRPGPGEPQVNATPLPTPRREIPGFLGKGIVWLAAAQNEDGGWGAGSHARQDIRDPHAVKSDPATTAFAGLALVRAGNTPTSGEYKANVTRALEHLVGAIEASGDGPK